MSTDIRIALRTIASHGWFSAAIVLTLALGIGVNTTVFTLVNAVLFKPVSLPGGERLNMILGQVNGTNRTGPVSYPDFLEFQKQNKSFEGIEAMQQFSTTIVETSVPPAEYRGERVSWRLFDLLRTPPVLGRGFVEGDANAGAANVALIGYSVWRIRYGGAPDVVGRVVRINGQPTTIIGVMPEGFRFPAGHDLWVPLTATRQLLDGSFHGLQLIGIRRPGISNEQATADLAVIAKRLESAHPTNKNIGAVAQTFHQAFNGGNIRVMFFIMLGAVGFVLLIACANVANMMLSRALERGREMSVRAAMGASRWQLARCMLTESVMLSVAGGLLGLGLAQGGVRYFDGATAEVRPYWIRFDMDWVACAYFAILTIGSGMLFGFMPALRGSRVDLNSALKEGARTAGSRRGGWLSAALVVLQFGLTAVLLSGAGLMVKSFFNAQSVNEFIPSAQLFTARVSLPAGKGERYEDTAKRVRFYDELHRRLTALPGVSHAAIASSPPGLGAGDDRVEIEGRPPAPDASRAIHATRISVRPGFFDTVGLRIEAGRDFGELDGRRGREAAIATRGFAIAHWPGESALGKRFRLLGDSTPGPWLTIVGISRDLAQNLQTSDPRPAIFTPHGQDAWGGMALIVRTAGSTASPASLASPIRTAVQQIDPELPLFSVFTMDEAADRQRWFLRVFGALFTLFAAIGLLIASMGIYSVVAQAAATRTREIGIRMALGATARDILREMIGRGAWQLVIGMALGLGAALATTKLMANLLVRVSPGDPGVFTAVTVLLVSVGLLASFIPARRAAALHPVAALRED